MKGLVICILLWALVVDSNAQLVRRKDYDAAFAIQLGGGIGVLTALHHAVLSVTPVAGLKMTFPFTRKWFLGGEVNYGRMKYGMSQQVDIGLPSWGTDVYFKARQKADFDWKQISVPLYVKYMLNCNKASVLFGCYGSYVFDARLSSSLSGERYSPGSEKDIPVTLEQDLSRTSENWNVGITVGYEHQIVRHLNLMCRISAGVKKAVKQNGIWQDQLFPLGACITLSYDIFRIGDCGCD